jgi:hypothetical protein
MELSNKKIKMKKNIKYKREQLHYSKGLNWIKKFKDENAIKK